MSLQVHQQRPRELGWFHAAGMLFGDWGTSRLYVLGLAFFYSGASAPWHVLAMCLLLVVVGWAYTVVCRCFHDGGGVYSSAKATHQQVALLGAYLLFADYVVTAALSAVDAFRYFGASTTLAPKLAIISILLVAGINFVGPKKAGRFASTVGTAMFFIMVITAVIALRHFSFADVHMDHRPMGIRWTSFVHIILALSGVEAVANMTGVMVEPVARTARRAIWLVMAEVVVFNMFFAVTMTHVPSIEKIEKSPAPILADRPEHELSEHDLAARDTMLKVIAAELVNPTFAIIAAGVFGMLLMSAVNTAVADMISVQYAMARDGELPHAFTQLNAFGVPWLGLVTAVVICTIVLLVQGDVEKLAHLYAIGVIGAITLNLGSTSFNRHIDVKKWERILLAIIALFLLCVECTIAYQKVEATIFAGSVIAGGYILRALVRRAPALKPYIPRVADTVGSWFEAPPVPESETLSLVGIVPFDPERQRILVCTRGNPELLRFAAEEAEARHSNLLVLFVRDLRLPYGPAGAGQFRLEDDNDAMPVFNQAYKLAREHRVPLMPIYCVARSPAEMILDFAGTYAADYVIMGVTRRGGLFRALRGDIISEVAANLPPETKLLIHA
ncbi:MAG TPA: amino acid permease [Phycisphaerae bacterium]|nr:amino acid permease [Phycisphaerae bacterium]